jgi:hypothetical protein
MAVAGLPVQQIAERNARLVVVMPVRMYAVEMHARKDAALDVLPIAAVMDVLAVIALIVTAVEEVVLIHV